MLLCHIFLVILITFEELSCAILLLTRLLCLLQHQKKIFLINHSFHPKKNMEDFSTFQCALARSNQTDEKTKHSSFLIEYYFKLKIFPYILPQNTQLGCKTKKYNIRKNKTSLSKNFFLKNSVVSASNFEMISEKNVLHERSKEGNYFIFPLYHNEFHII